RASAEGRVNDLNGQIGTLTEQVNQKQSDLNRANKDLKTAQTSLRLSKIDLKTAQASLRLSKADLAKQIALLKTQRIKTEAARIVSGIGQERNHAPDAEINLIWALATNTEDVRRSFVEQVLESTDTAERFSNRSDILSHAMVGLSGARR